MPKGCDCPVCKGDGAFHRVRKNKDGDRKIVSIKCKDCGAMSGVMLIPVEAGAKYAIEALRQEWKARVEGG